MNKNTYAVIDLGSNSFRVEVFECSNGKIIESRYQKKTVRLGGALDKHKMLSEVAMKKGWQCLKEFKLPIKNIPACNIRIVATQTLREATNSKQFTDKAEEILGLPVEVISGKEEARLIYIGVFQYLTNNNILPDKMIAIDIGGRSTEIITGEKENILFCESLPIGSVNVSQEFFIGSTAYTDASFTESIKHASDIFTTVIQRAKQTNFSTNWVYGSAGTIRAVGELLQNHQITNGEITLTGLNWLCKTIIEFGNSNNINLIGLKEDRKPVLGGGVAILLALFQVFKLEKITYSTGSLRHGALKTLLK